MKKRYLECGKIVSTHGVKGELRVQPWADSPEYLLSFSTLYLEKGEKPLQVERMRTNKNMVLLKAKGVDSMDDAVTLRGQILYIDREDDPEGEGFFLQDLYGLTVEDADSGRIWGELTDVFSTGANDVYEITGEDGKKRLIPAIPAVVLQVDTDGGTMRIRPLEGLFDDED